MCYLIREALGNKAKKPSRSSFSQAKWRMDGLDFQGIVSRQIDLLEACFALIAG